MIALPILLLALITACRGPRYGWWIPVGLLLAAAGDLMGSLGAFLPQMALFASALVCYLADFVPRCRVRKGRLGGVAVALVAFLTAFAWLAVRIPAADERFAVTGYALLLLALLLSALLQVRAGWRWQVAAALLFILSDGMIGYCRYVAPIPWADGWIMSSYYLAQLLFAWRYWVQKPQN